MRVKIDVENLEITIYQENPKFKTKLTYNDVDTFEGVIDLIIDGDITYDNPLLTGVTEEFYHA